jgi:hypothetical protein
MNNETIDQLKNGNGEIPPELSDEDMRQLIIHYATIVRTPKVTIEKVIAARDSWPESMQKAFEKMIWDNAVANNCFWHKPAEINIKYGIG